MKRIPREVIKELLKSEAIKSTADIMEEIKEREENIVLGCPSRHGAHSGRPPVQHGCQEAMGQTAANAAVICR